jgi:hypothetical protein
MEGQPSGGLGGQGQTLHQCLCFCITQCQINAMPLCAVPIHSPFFWSAVPAWARFREVTDVTRWRYCALRLRCSRRPPFFLGAIHRCEIREPEQLRCRYREMVQFDQGLRPVGTARGKNGVARVLQMTQGALATTRPEIAAELNTKR